MSIPIRLSLSLLILFSSVLACSSQVAPKVALSTARIAHKGFVQMKGSGFSVKQNVSSHLRRPDGSEFPVLPILTDDRGEFNHEIDTLLLGSGIHEVWVVDDMSKTTSNVARFEVTPY
jgi:hypothetical protein